MGSIRLTANQLELSGLDKHNKKHYSSYNMTKGNVEGFPEPRTGLSKESKAAWNLIVSDLVEGKELSRGDLPSLCNLIEAYEEVVKVKKAIKQYDKEHNLSEPTFIHERKKLNDWLINSIKAYSVLASKFGLTPTDRTKLPIIQEEIKEEDPLEILIEG